MLTILLTAFGRAVAEVGAVMIVGGNIDGVTRVMTTAIALETSKGDLPLALALGVVLLAVVALVNLVIGLLNGARGRARAACLSAACRIDPHVADAVSRAEGHMAPLLQPARCVVRFGDVQALRGMTPDAAPRRAAGAGRCQRLGQDHLAAPAARAGAAARPARAACRVRWQGRTAGGGDAVPAPFLLSLSVRWNVLLGLWLRGVPRARTRRALRARAAACRAGAAGRAAGATPCRAASSSAWRWRAPGRSQPDLLLLDEPTASLDPGAKREVEALIDEIAADGVTVVMSTHNLGQAKRLATRVAYLEAGRLVVDLPVDSFFNDTLPNRGSPIPQRRVAMELIRSVSVALAWRWLLRCA